MIFSRAFGLFFYVGCCLFFCACHFSTAVGWGGGGCVLWSLFSETSHPLEGLTWGWGA